MAREGKARVLTPAEFKRAEVAALSMRHGKRNAAILYLSFCLALRAGEIRQLRFFDVLEADKETLVQEINLLKCMTKGNKQRHVPFTNKKARLAVMEYIKSYREKYEHLEFDLTNPLFPSQKGGFMSPTAFIDLFVDIFHTAGLNGAKSHSGRRTFITRHVEMGTDIKVLQVIAGHEHINTTAGYMEVNPLRLKRIAEKSVI
jgi:integrase/recombinase XerD